MCILTAGESLIKSNSINIKLILRKYKMDNSPDMLDFVKAASDTDRLWIIGVLVQHPSTIKAVAQELKIPFRQAFTEYYVII
jgi:hypothetical protein